MGSPIWFTEIQRRRGLASGRSRDRKNKFRNGLIVSALNSTLRPDDRPNVAAAARRMDRKVRSLRRVALSMGHPIQIVWPVSGDAQRMVIHRLLRRLEGPCVDHACQGHRKAAAWLDSERQPVIPPLRMRSLILSRRVGDGRG